MRWMRHRRLPHPVERYLKLVCRGISSEIQLQPQHLGPEDGDLPRELEGTEIGVVDLKAVLASEGRHGGRLQVVAERAVDDPIISQHLILVDRDGMQDVIVHYRIKRMIAQLGWGLGDRGHGKLLAGVEDLADGGTRGNVEDDGL